MPSSFVNGVRMSSAAFTLVQLLLLRLVAAENGSPQVEVASIKPSRPDATVQNAWISYPPGRVQALNMTLTEILDSLRGYDGRVRGGPKWAQADRYDIVAKLDAKITPDERAGVVVALLKDRFKLEIHQEETTESVLAVTVGKGASRLQVAKDDEVTKVEYGIHKVVFQAAGLHSLANYLHNIFHATVLDRTGLTGKFDFTLDIDRAAEELAGSSVTGSSFPDRVRFAAESLGFQLVTVKAALDTTVIDHAERPSDN
jgi:uncharacterized protein (TIGR03435 family)